MQSGLNFATKHWVGWQIQHMMNHQGADLGQRHWFKYRWKPFGYHENVQNQSDPVYSIHQKSVGYN
jgi:hypothetical protein